MMERLETERLILRRPTAEDRDAYIAYYASEWRAMHGPVVPADRSRARYAAILNHWETKGFGRFVVERRDIPVGIGLVGPHFPDSYMEPEITWQLWARDQVGNGFTFEAAMAVRQYAYETLGWQTAVSYIHSENARSIRLAAQMGAVHDPDARYPASIGQHEVYRHPGPANAAVELSTPAQRRSSDQTLAPTLQTPRLTLRPFRLEDFEPYAAFLASDRSAGLHGPHTRQKAWTWFTNDIAHWSLFGFGGLIIEVDGKAVGQVAVTKGIDFPEPELGWFLFEGFEGQGYATEAATALRNHVFANTGLKTLVSYCDPDNAASIAVAGRLGCRLDDGAERPEGIECRVYRHPAPDSDGSVEAYAWA